MRWLSFILLTTLTAYACTPALENDTTRWGGNERIELNESKPVPELHGVVAWWDGTVVHNVLVEAFLATPRSAQDDGSNNQKRVTGCVTGEDGSFHLKLPPGRYEVRFSLDKGVNVTVMHITVAAKARQRTLRVIIHVGRD